MFDRGDRIKYTPAHLAWLREAGLWPVKAWAKPFFGTVLETEEDRVRVEWDAGRPWPRNYPGAKGWALKKS